MSSDPQCPQCHSKNTYFDGNLWNCPDCGKEWNPDAEGVVTESSGYKDAFGNELVEGDSVTVIKELKVKGSSSAVKVGTKVKNIRLGDFGNDHDISCKIPGIGSMYLKSEYVKKA